MAEKVNLTFDGKTLKGQDGSSFELADILGGKIGKIVGVEMSFLVETEGAIPKTALRVEPTQEQEKAAAEAAAAAATAATGATIKPITKGSKVDEMFKLMRRSHGVTFKELQEKFGWSDGAVGSYVYFYPKDCGYQVEKTKRANGEIQYRLKFPDGVKGIAYK